jgi:cystathionine beta-lyase
MKYDFTSIIDRHGMDAMAVDALEAPGMIPAGETDPQFTRIPMWVADMNFATAPSVTEAMKKRLEHPLFGYFRPRGEYFDSIISWQEKRNGVTGLTRDAIGYENGVLGGIASMLHVLCQEGDSVLVHSPTYVGFTGTLRSCGYNIVSSPLVPDEDGIFRMDLADMEEKIRENHIHTAIFCSPHNPTGRVWTREELEAAMELFRRYDVYVISDEIWSDLVLSGRHIPLQSVSEDARMRTAAFYAPSKTFNLAGLVGSYHIVYNSYLRDRLLQYSGSTHYNAMNVLSMYALIGAYSEEGAEWVDELREVLRENISYATSFIRENFHGVRCTEPEGTYMLFLDCTDWCRAHGTSIDELQSAGIRAGVIWQDGRPFGGDCTIRLNLALPKSLLVEALDRLKFYVFA